MNLLVNTESLVPPLTGIGLYTRHLLAAYRTGLIEGEIHCFAGSRLCSAEQALGRLEQSLHAGPALRRRERRMALLHRVASHTSLPYHLHQYRVRKAFARATRLLPERTIYHEPNYILKPYAGPSVATVHDLSVFHYPEFHPKARVRHLERNLPRTLDRADHVITDSELVRDELLSRFGLRESRVTAIHLGVSEEFRPVEPQHAERVLGTYGLDVGGYTLCVSTFEPRKNVSALLDAYASLPGNLRRRFPLVLAGAKGWLSTEADRKLDRLAARGEVKRLGYVPGPDLPALYSGAAVFVFPSIYEGFGLPVLEAMACGAPVITSIGTSMAEIVDGCATLVNPRETEAMSAGIRQLLDDPGARESLATAGRARASGFTWSGCARRHVEVFRSLRVA